MALSPGEYTFHCTDCWGEGTVEVTVSADDTITEDCEYCGGTGVVTLDEEEAEEAIDCGNEPLSTPDRFPDIDWFCDNCNDYLNDQVGFHDHHRKWACTECDHENSISEGSILPRDGGSAAVADFLMSKVLPTVTALMTAWWRGRKKRGSS